MVSYLAPDDGKWVYGDAGFTGTGKHLGEEKDAPAYWYCIAR